MTDRDPKPDNWVPPDSFMETWSDGDKLRWMARANLPSDEVAEFDAMAARLDAIDRLAVGPFPKRHPRLRCADHPDVEADSWGCPDCVAFLRHEVGRLTSALARLRDLSYAERAEFGLGGDPDEERAWADALSEADRLLGGPAF
jgi:hypothetical protein